MAEVYKDDYTEMREYLISVGFDEDDADMRGLEGYEEEPYKRSTRCSGYLLNSLTGDYHLITFDNDYDWGNSNYVFYLEPLKKVEEVVTTTVTKFVSKEKQ